jgi:glucose/arabinose dehydrogenase
MLRLITLMTLATTVVAAAPQQTQQTQQAPPPQTPPAPRPPRQPPKDPFVAPIEATEGVITVNFVEFATVPDVNGRAPRLMHFADEPATKRIFVSEMIGGLYSISYDGKTVTPFLDVNDAKWGIGVQSRGSERGLQSFAFHPQFNRRGTPGYGKFYTYTDTTNVTPVPDFTPSAPNPPRAHDMVLLEWTAKNPAAATYDGEAPRELFRISHPYSNHNGGQIAFNPLATSGSADFGLLFVGSADGGSGGDPMNMAQNMSSIFGKILRIDPLGKNSANGKYGIPASNPFRGTSDVLGEIYALGVRNPQRFSWDAKTGKLYVADIGQNLVEEISPVTAGANLGWNKWEASYKYVGGTIDLENPRAEEGMTWPIAEFDHTDPLLPSGRAAITGVYVYRQSAIRQLRNRMLFGDNPSGEIFWIDADKLPDGGQAPIRRVLLNDRGTSKTLLQLIKEKNTAQGKTPATRADLRLGEGPQGQIFVMNKGDGVIRLLVPDAK